MDWLYDLFQLDPVARSINQERLFTNSVGACVAIAIFVLIFVGWILKLLWDGFMEARENRAWLKHCEHCAYFHGIRYKTIGYYDRRGVICYNGVGYTTEEKPLWCKRCKPQTKGEQYGIRDI